MVRPSPAVPSAPSITARTATWSDADLSTVALRFRHLGATERAARTYLGLLALKDVRRLRPYVDGIADSDLRRYLEAADRVAAAQEGQSRRRGDITFLRTPPRWPWRITAG